jgi:hypothetical protein
MLKVKSPAGNERIILISPAIAGLIFSGRLYLIPIMSTKARVTGVSRTPVVVSAPGTESTPSPVQRMRGKLHLADPAIARRIIFDPSLEQ